MEKIPKVDAVKEGLDDYFDEKFPRDGSYGSVSDALFKYREYLDKGYDRNKALRYLESGHDVWFETQDFHNPGSFPVEPSEDVVSSANQTAEEKLKNYEELVFRNLDACGGDTLEVWGRSLNYKEGTHDHHGRILIAYKVKDI